MYQGLGIHRILPVRKMKQTINIIIENKLLLEKRGLNVYHRADRGIHLISGGSSYTVSLNPRDETDYINLSVAIGPGYMEQSNVIDLPSWLNYEFLSEGKLVVKHDGGRNRLTIPAGLPEWKLKLTLPASPIDTHQGRVIVSEYDGK